MWPLSQGELLGKQETFLDVVSADPARLVAPAASATTRTEHEQLILAGGFPIAVARPTPTSRGQWFSDFVSMVVERDVLEIRRIRQRRVMPLLMRHLAGQTAGMLNVSDIASRVQLDNRLVGDFVALLESVFLVHRLEAFGRTLSGRHRTQEFSERQRQRPSRPMSRP
jgi:predicted AAA+ superfamily ATPase